MKLRVAEDIYVDKIYVINLAHHTERLASLTEHLKKHDIFEYVTIFPGVYLPQDPTHGCRLSHMGILDDAIKNNYEIIMVLEDDCRFTEFPFNLTERVPEDWMMVYPGYLCMDELSWKENSAFLRLVDGRSTYCYIIRNEIFKFARKFISSNDSPVDMRFINAVQRTIPCYGIYPPRAHNGLSVTSIGHSAEAFDWTPISNDKAEKCYNNRKPDNYLQYQYLDFYLENKNG